MRRAILLSSALALVLSAACGRSEEATTAAPEAPAPTPLPAPQPSETIDFNRPLNLLGNEPFWSLQIRADGLKFSAPDHDDVEATNPGPEISGREAVWTGDAKGQPVKATLTAAVCQDGMSGLLYPFKAKVELEGRVLEGCAAYADAMPREGAGS
jgi:putative lipoprotein